MATIPTPTNRVGCDATAFAVDLLQIRHASRLRLGEFETGGTDWSQGRGTRAWTRIGERVLM